MSLYHRPKDRENLMETFDPCHDEKHMRIPSVIIVPQRPIRITSTMAQHYRGMPGAGAEISPTVSGRVDEGTKSSKPWKVDMAKKSYTSGSNRRFKKSSRRRSAPLLPAPPAPSSPPISEVICGADGLPDLEGLCIKDDSDSGYPSDEENGFGGGCGGGFSSRNSSPASSTNSGGSMFGSIQLKGYYGGSTRNRRFRRV